MYLLPQIKKKSSLYSFSQAESKLFDWIMRRRDQLGYPQLGPENLDKILCHSVTDLLAHTPIQLIKKV